MQVQRYARELDLGFEWPDEGQVDATETDQGGLVLGWIGNCDSLYATPAQIVAATASPDATQSAKP